MAPNQREGGEFTRPPVPKPIARAHVLQLEPQQIVIVPAKYRNGRPWKHTLCSCTCAECLQSVFCSCAMAGNIWQKALEKSFEWGIVSFLFLLALALSLEFVCATFIFLRIFMVFWLFPVFYALLWTGPLRAQGGIAGEFCGDCCTCCWCPCCQIIREQREAEEMWNEQRRNIAPVVMRMI